MSRTRARRPRDIERGGAPRSGDEEFCRTGIAVSPGVAIGRVFLAAETSASVPRRDIACDEVAGELARFEAAIERSLKQLNKLRSRLTILPQSGQAELSPLLDAYAQMVGPSRLTRGVRRRIGEALVDAPTAVADETEALTRAILAAAQPDDVAGQARYAEEVREIGRRLIRNLTDAPFRSLAALPAGSVLVCDSLRPADAALLDPARVAGVACEEGGEDGHTAIMLRALGIPAVLGLAGFAAAAHPGETLVVDGGSGRAVLAPGGAALAEAHAAMAAAARARQKLHRLRRLPAVTTCGVAVELQANLEVPAELALVAQAGAAGIGLLRSEFLFINRDALPDEAAQVDVYRPIIEAMAPDPVTVRVLDWGGEKESEALRAAGLLPEPAETNPALGLRGIRLLLRHPELLEVQLAAILRAAAGGQARILLPMVNSPAEVRAVRATMAQVVKRLRRRGVKLPMPLPPLGVMIETPAAAVAAHALALEADFFAIGTNDLTMYALAADRGGPGGTGLYDPLHPGVLRLMGMAIEAALRLRKPVSVCGELASHPEAAALLLGMGLRSFSMNAGAVPRVKQAIRGLSVDECARLAQRVLEQAELAGVRALVLGEAAT